MATARQVTEIHDDEAATAAPDGAQPVAGAPGERVPAEAAPPDEAPELPSIERIVPWRHRINTQFLFVTIALAVAGVFMFALAEARMEEQLIESQAAGAALFTETILNATKRAMMENHRDASIETMREVARGDGVQLVRFLDKSGRVIYSSDYAEVGEQLATSAEPCRPCHQGGKPEKLVSLRDRTRIVSLDGARALDLVTPIRNEPRCSTAECHAHSPQAGVLGLLDVRLSLASVDARLASFRRSSMVLTAVSVLLLTGFFMVFARYQVVRPVQALVAATRRVAGQGLDTEIRVTSRGELGLLAASFNDMTRSLRRAEGELRALMAGLEHEVDQRTKDLRTAQAALVQSEKLSSLGRLSASIAHEINNPLAGILTFSKLIIRTLEGGAPDDATRKDLMRNMALVQRETERCSAIVRNLLDFARDRPVTLRETNLNSVIDEGLQLIAHQIAMQGHVLEKHLSPVPNVLADFGQMRQAVVNVALNACQAMGKNGKLSIATRVAADGFVEIAIADDGPGISPENLKHIFDPFFTTKEKGTGLGLSVVYGIVERHHGRIDVKSEEGKGTLFRIRIPVAGSPEGSGGAAPPRA